MKIWVRDKINVDLNMTTLTILFGSKYDYVLTLLMSLAKFHIYRAKMTEKRPNFEAFKQEIKYYYNILKYQASCNLEVDKFMKKWLLWLPLVQDTIR